MAEALAALPEADLVEAMVRARRMASRCQVEELAIVAELAHRRFTEAEPATVEVLSSRDYVYDEVASALTLTARSADELISLATGLRERLPGTFAALAAGRIDYAKARALWHGTLLLDPDLILAVEVKALPRAGEQTTGQLRAKVRRLVESLDPGAAENRRREAQKQRRLEILDDPSGTAHLTGCGLPADQASTAFNRVNAIATALKQDGDHRAIAQLRADVFLNLLHGIPTTPASAPETVPAAPSATAHRDTGLAFSTTGLAASAAPTGPTARTGSAAAGVAADRVAELVGEAARVGLNSADAAVIAEAGERIATALRGLTAEACVTGHRYRPPAAMRRHIERRGRALPVPGLPAAREPLRPRPHDRLPSRQCHVPVQPVASVPSAPSAETDETVAAHPPLARRPDVDHPHRPLEDRHPRRPRIRTHRP